MQNYESNIKDNGLLFREVQRYRWYIPVSFVCLMIFPASFLCLASFVCGLSLIMLKILIGIMVIFIFLFCVARLETEVYQDGLYVRFFPTHIRYKKIAAEDIAEHCVRTYDSLGYGKIWPGVMRYSSDDKTWAYITRGNKGVQLVLKNGKKLLIGSQKPEELSNALNPIMSKSEGSI